MRIVDIQKAMLIRLPHRWLSTCFVLTVSCLIYSCAAYKETFENPNRHCFKDPEYGTLECEGFIKFQCTEDLTLPPNSPITRQKTLNVKHSKDIEAPMVGNYLAYDTGDPLDKRDPNRIFIKNGSPWVTLNEDITKILSQMGYMVSNNHNDDENVIEINIKLLDVQTGGGWTDFKSTTRATVVFSVVLKRSTNEVLWSEEFTGEHEIKVVYAYLKDSETTLEKAYCNALKNFADAVQKQEFYDAVK